MLQLVRGAEIEGPAWIKHELLFRHRLTEPLAEDASVLWRVFARDFINVDFEPTGDGAGIVWTAPPGVYRVDVTVFAGGKVDGGVMIVTVGDDDPTPPPVPPDPVPPNPPDPVPPPPPPDPNPDLPDDAWGLAKWVYGQRGMISQHRDRAAAAAAAFTATSQAIQDRQVASVPQAFALLMSKTQAAVPPTSEAAGEWKPFFDAIQQELMRQRDGEPGISSLDELGAALGAIGAGLAAIAPAGRMAELSDLLRIAAAGIAASGEETRIVAVALRNLRIGEQAEAAWTAGRLVTVALAQIADRTERFGRDPGRWRGVLETAAAGPRNEVDHRLAGAAEAIAATGG